MVRKIVTGGAAAAVLTGGAMLLGVLAIERMCGTVDVEYMTTLVERHGFGR